MTSALLLLLVVMLVVLAFEYINGFHDTANAIATVVSTKVLTPRQALFLAASMNLLGSFMGQAVAKTIQGGIVDDKIVAITSITILSAMLGAIFWNLVTWWFGMPSSSSHALIGGLVGAALAKSHMDWHTLIWSRAKADGSMEGIYHKVVIPMIGSPILGFTFAFLFMGLIFALLSHWRPVLMSPIGGLFGAALAWFIPNWLIDAAGFVLHFFGDYKLGQFSSTVTTVTAIIGFLVTTRICWSMGNWRTHMIGTVFSKLQLVSAAAMGLGHGQADAQKTMGIIMLTLASATAAHDLDGAPSWLGFLHIANPKGEIPFWIKLLCALTMAAGTYAGGWRIIKTLGHKMVKMKPVHGFAAETTAAILLNTTGHFGMPVSTTHVITTSIMGVGAAKRANSINWSLVERILWAWVMTIPAAAAMAFIIEKLLMSFGNG